MSTLAHNGQEGLDHFMAEDYDIVLMDMMPSMDRIPGDRAIYVLTS